MSGPQKNHRNKYAKVILALAPKQMLTFISKQVERYGLGQTIIIYRLGWLRSAGKPVRPALRDDPSIYGPSLNSRTNKRNT